MSCSAEQIGSRLQITDRHRALATIHGTGYDSDLLIVSEIGDIRRLPNAKKQCSCTGLVLSVRSSDDKTRHGSIKKLGSKWLHWILIERSRRFAKSCSRRERMYRQIGHKHGKKPPALPWQEM